MTLGRNHSWPEGHWDWPIHLSHKHGLRCGEMIFVSGQSARDASGAVVAPGGILRQSELLLQNIGTVPAEFGADHDDAVRFRMDYAAAGPAATGLPVPRFAPEGLMARMELIAMAE